MKKVLGILLLCFAVSGCAQTFTNSTKVIGVASNNVVNYSGAAVTNAVFYGDGEGLTNVIGLFNVKQYGATGGGVANDSAAVQAAINAGAGRTVFFPAGTYRLLSTITNIANNTKLMGEGSGRMYETEGFSTRSGTVLSFTGTITNGIKFASIYGLNQTNNYAEISDLTIDCNNEVEVGIYMTGCHALRNVNITGCLVAGLLLYGNGDTGAPYNMVNSFTADNCSFIYNPAGSGVLIYGAAWAGLITPYHFRNCIFRANYYGVDLQAGYQSTFESCIFEQNLYEGLHVYKYGTAQHLNNVVFRDCWWEANATSASGTNKCSLSIDSETLTGDGAARGLKFENCYFQLDSAEWEGYHFNIKSALYIDFDHCIYYGGTNAGPFILGANVSKLRASSVIYPWNYTGIESTVKDDLDQFYVTNEFNIKGGFSTTNSIYADGSTGYGGGIRGEVTQGVGGNLLFYTRNNYVETERARINPYGYVQIGSSAAPNALVIPYNAAGGASVTTNHSINAFSTALVISSKSDTGVQRSVVFDASSVSISNLVVTTTATSPSFSGPLTGNVAGNVIAPAYVNIPFSASAYAPYANGFSVANGYSSAWIVSRNGSGAIAPITIEASSVIPQQNFLPSPTETHNLGGPSNKYKDGFFSGALTGTSYTGASASVEQVTLRGSTSGYTALTVPAVAGTLGFKFPATAGGANYTLQTDGSGNTSWSGNLSAGTIAGTTITAPTFVVSSQLVFTNSVWDDLQIPGLSVKTGASAPTFGFFPGQTAFQLYLFGGASTDNDVYFTAQIPHSYKQGSDIIAHVHWFPTTASSSKNMIWTMTYEWDNIGGVMDGTANTLGGTAIAVPAAAGTHTVSSFAAMSGAGKTISSMIICKLKREASNGVDTYPDDVALLQIDFHFQKDTVGSIGSTSK